MNYDPLKTYLTDLDVINFRQYLLENFFQEKIRKHGNKWDSIIKISRKGTFVYDDLSEGYPVTENDLSSFKLPFLDSRFDNKSILLFDDSIRTGDTITSYIKQFPNSKITVASIIIEENVLDFLKKNHKDIHIIYHLVLNMNEYKKFYYKFMSMYFDYICVPQITLLSDEFIFFDRLEKNEIQEIFTIGKNIPYECKTWDCPTNNRFKMGINFNRNEMQKIISKIFPQIPNANNSQCKVRLFTHKYENETKVYVEYIFVPDFILPRCNKSLDDCYSPSFFGKEAACPICCNYYFADFIRSQMKENLNSKNISFTVNSLEWYFNEYRIDPNNSL